MSHLDHLERVAIKIIEVLESNFNFSHFPYKLNPGGFNTWELADFDRLVDLSEPISHTTNADKNTYSRPCFISKNWKEFLPCLPCCI